MHRSVPLRRDESGFSLVELLVVFAIMGILVGLAGPAFHLLRGAGDFSRAVNGVMDSVTFARTYAMANNTYVFLGIVEHNRSQDPANRTPQDGIGEVVVAVVASKDGTSDKSPDNLAIVRPLQVYEGVHLLRSLPQGVGSMARPDTDVHHLPGDADFFSQGAFSVTVGGMAYHFNTDHPGGVISFTPQGISPLDGQAVQWIEIAMQACPGAAAPEPPRDANKADVAAVVIDGATGVPRLYRP